MCKPQVISSGLKSSSSAALAVPGKVHGVTLIPDGTHACGVIVYNNASGASGKEIVDLALPANSTLPQDIHFNEPVVCNLGIYGALSGTGGKFIIHYSVGD